MNIRIHGQHAGKVSLTKTDEGIFTIVKTRKGESPFHCMKCSRTIKWGEYCWGTRNVKYCYSCGEKVMDSFCDSLETIAKDMRIKKSQNKEKEGEILKNNMVAELQDMEGENENG